MIAVAAAVVGVVLRPFSWVLWAVCLDRASARERVAVSSLNGIGSGSGSIGGAAVRPKWRGP